MKTIKLSFLFLALLTIAACSDDDDGMTAACTQADWVGTYTGTIDCDGTTDNVTVTITASGTNNVVVDYASSTLQTTYDPLPIAECDLDATANAGALTVSLEADLAGNVLTLSEVIADSTGVGSNCMITATRN